jgi:glycosyltransferase involved in cell wall biosynthesis
MPRADAVSPRLKVLVVGQTPPPLGGQSIAIDSFARGTYRGIQVSLVRMAFSGGMEEVGKFRARKLGHLCALIPRILWHRRRTGASVLYYPPAGPDLVPVLRDLVILICTRWAFRRTVFHFHAGGLSEIYPRLPAPLRPLFRLAYLRPDLAIQPSDLNPEDSAFVQARRTVIVPGGVADHLPAAGPVEARDKPVLLYVGVLRESKGLLVLIEACRHLRDRSRDFEVHLMGQFESMAFEHELRAAVRDAGLASQVTFLGTLTGAAKDRCFRNSDVFCYPTHFESETFGLVLIEAMQFELPVVGTRWRGVPSIIEDEKNGFLVPIKDPATLADRLELLLDDPETARRLGRVGREMFLARFTEERFQQQMESALLLVSGDGAVA